MVKTALEVSNLFKKNENINIAVVNCRYIKPLDEIMLSEISKKYEYIYTIEEGSISGGFGSSVMEYFSMNNIKKININLLGIPDKFIDHGNRKQLLDLVGLSTNTIYEKIKNEQKV